MATERTAPRDTKYAREIASAALVRGASEIRIERLFVKEPGQVEVRFSWWKDGRLVPRPPDLTEEELLEVFAAALPNGVFSDEFRRRLKALL